MAETAVVNASPLIFLGAADLLDLLLLAGPRVFVPRPVYREVTAKEQGRALGEKLPQLPWLEIVETSPVPASVVTWDLGAGEASVLAWALCQPGAVAIIDDLAGRKCARAHEIPLKGTLGLVLLARQRGIIPSARSVLRQMRSAGMYIADTTLNKALAEIGE